ncbi:AMP-binding protein [Bradyrhizobium sp. ISRA443]|uniref:AMP-binding protein n=1 Tax=unclassified Bradyrhizobium TaxID=2631580 RepID=UPI002478A31C|nr:MULTISPECIES: AMP-binding protein [unclassified Bradyrhizobium]WGR99079.1 AMP-binding protein [Bradyrhizobium sp. ISRA436]WGS05970.1 AMP-binding protein [Bradyrhizobium sp. ISRA437]WGS12856.1 AMP-binding protein [Bradyrhizobium sp. ISRA443]
MYTVFSVFAAAADAAAFRSFLCIPARPDRAYFPDGIELSYGDIARQACALRDQYRAAGFDHGHRACLLLENRPDFIVHWLALNGLGVSIVPINPAYRAAEIEYLIAHAEPDLIVTLPDQKELQKALGGAVPLLAVSGDDLGVSVTRIPLAKRPPPRADDPGSDTEAALLYTSGTTARPKGCILTNEYVVGAGRWYASRGGEATYHVGTERLYSPLPLFHIAGLTLTTMAMMLTGGCLILPERFNAKFAWRDIVTCRATVLHYLGVIVAALLAQPETPDEKAHALRFSMGVGANPEQRASARARFGIPFVEGWGMTETGRSPFNTVEPRHLETNTIGRSEPGLEMTILDADGNAVPKGMIGELCVRHSDATPRRGFFSGYLKDPEATEQAWRGGWFHTGDSAWQHDDGAFVFVDRLKHLVRRAGENISAAEVEAVLTTSRLVKQAAVVAARDPIRDEEVAAFIVLHDGVDASPTLAQEIFRLCRERLAPFKLPAWVAFVAELPLTSTNKIQKHTLLGADKDPRSHPGMIDLRQDKTSAIRQRN